MPVISPAGEVDDPTPFIRRDSAMVVFGLAGTRKLAYQKLEAAGNLVSALGIQEILDVGPEFGHPTTVNGIRVKRNGTAAS